MRGWLAVILAALVFPVAGEEAALVGTGPRPELHVYDPGDVLTAEVEEVIGRPLERIRKNEFIDVIVVILSDFGDAPPEHVARSFAAAWCDAAANCIVLHVPGREESPWIFPGGRITHETPLGVIGPAVEGARSRAARETGVEELLRTAATEATDMLRMWVGSNAHLSEMLLTQRVHAQQEWEMKQRRRKILVIGAIGICVPVILGLVALMVSSRRRRGRRFPRIHWQRRLGAPHSGGNQISHTPQTPPPS